MYQLKRFSPSLNHLLKKHAFVLQQLIGGDTEAPQDPHFIFLRARARRVSTRTTLCLLLTALIVVSIGIICGTYLYRQYLRSQIFKGWCNFPVEQQQSESAMLLDTNFIQEEFEIDVNREEYEKINVPDFRDGRSGRFIHDFNTNKTGIVDITGQRCFIMPLNRDYVLPPKSLFDLIQKIWDGYYKVNTEIVRETMRVVTPPIEDASEAGSYIAKECSGMHIYRLEKYVGGGKISFYNLFFCTYIWRYVEQVLYLCLLLVSSIG